MMNNNGFNNMNMEGMMFDNGMGMNVHNTMDIESAIYKAAMNSINKAEGKAETTEVENDYEPCEITIETSDFEESAKIKFTRTNDLAIQLNKIFKPLIIGYFGCVISPNQMGQLATSLYLIPTQDVINGSTNDTLPETSSMVYGLQLAAVNNKSNNEIFNKLKVNQLNRTNKRFQLTKDFSEMLTPFMLKGKNGQINWDKCVIEKVINNQLIIEVMNIDMIEILKAVYGSEIEETVAIGDNKNKSTKSVDYVINIITPIRSNGSAFVTNYLVQIIQADMTQMRALASLTSGVPQDMTLPIITEMR